jgi:hypothetical protein
MNKKPQETHYIYPHVKSHFRRSKPFIFSVYYFNSRYRSVHACNPYTALWREAWIFNHTKYAILTQTSIIITSIYLLTRIILSAKKGGGIRNGSLW